MRTPFELEALAELRRRGQAPKLAVFVTDDWRWADTLVDAGVLAIRVRNPRDHGHDWSPLAGLFVILSFRRPAASDLADFATEVLAVNPQRLQTYTDVELREVWAA